MKIEFKESVVAFIDVLGYGNLVNSACKKNEKDLGKLESLVAILSNSVIKMNNLNKGHVPESYIPDHIFISDSIILNLTIENIPDDENFTAVDIIVLRCIQIYQELISQGFVVRGYVDIGPNWIENGNVIGSTYINCVNNEKKVGDPLIEVSKEVFKLWEKNNDLTKESSIIMYKSKYFVNVFQSFHLRNNTGNQSGKITECLEEQMKNVFLNYDEAECDKHKDKWIGLLKFMLKVSGDELDSLAMKLGIFEIIKGKKNKKHFYFDYSLSLRGQY